METARQAVLREQSEMLHLVQALEGNGLTEELKKVELLLDYLESLDYRFNQVVEELQEIKGHLALIQDKEVESSAADIVKQVDVKFQELGGTIKAVKTNFLYLSKDAVTTMKEKGKDALKQAISAMKIPAVLAYLKETFSNGARFMEKEGAKLEMLRGEFHCIGEHTKNIVRVFTGRKQQELSERQSDKGILLKMQSLCRSCGRQLSGMEEKTEKALKRMELFIDRETKKDSVKDVLKQIKSEKSVGKALQPPVKQQER
ncbi:MAG: hypothetical protein QM793_12540 [Muricomes sp.]